MSADRHLAAVTYCMRADARQVWRSWLALGVLVGLAAGAAMAAAAAGNRTDTAYRDLRAESSAMDGAIVVTCDTGRDPDCPTSIEDIQAWPGVADAARFTTATVPILDRNGDLIQATGDTCYSGAGAVSLITPVDPAFGTRLHGLRILEGRAADPARADEVVMAPLAAEELGIEIGDQLYPHLVDCQAERSDWGEPTPVTVVGIGLTAFEIPPKNGLYLQGVHTTPAFAGLVPGATPGAVSISPGADPDAEDQAGLPQVAVRLDPGVSFDDLAGAPGVPAFEVAFDQRTIGYPVDEGLRTDANAVWLVGLLTGVVSLFVLGPTLSRRQADAARVDRTLGALGWSRQDRVLRHALHGLAISAVALVVALVTMLVVSLNTPIGDARAIEPTPGVEIDLGAFLLGAAITTALVVGWLSVLAWRSTDPRRPPRRTPLASLAANVGASTALVLGIRVGLEPRRGQAPVRSAILAVVVGAMAITGVLVYTSSAQHLRETPAWLGLTFDDVIDVSENPEGVAIAERARTWPEVDTVGHLLLFLPPLDLGLDRGTTVAIAFSTGPDAVAPTVIDGRAPSGADELLLSPALADALDAEVGDRIEAVFDNRDATEGGVALPFSLEVVGIGPVPIGFGPDVFSSTMTYEGALAGLPPEMTAEMQDGPPTNVILIDRADGVTDEALAARLATEGLTSGEGAIDIATLRDNLVSVDPTSTESAPDLLGGIMALLAGSVLVYGLLTTVRRNHHDLAVARALGLSPRHLRRVTRWSATVFTLAALVVAVPLGLAVGRVAWRTYAESLDVVPDPVVQPLELVGFVGATVVLALAVGTVAGHLVTRQRPGAALRSE